jgi:hypothetical protein
VLVVPPQVVPGSALVVPFLVRAQRWVVVALKWAPAEPPGALAQVMGVPQASDRAHSAEVLVVESVRPENSSAKAQENPQTDLGLDYIPEQPPQDWNSHMVLSLPVELVWLAATERVVTPELLGPEWPEEVALLEAMPEFPGATEVVVPA